MLLGKRIAEVPRAAIIDLANCGPMKKPRLFISHSWKDKFFVNKLAEQLAARGVDVWVDGAELKIGDSLFQSISQAIAACDYFAIILSHNSVSSGWVQRELQLAMNLVLEKKNRRIRVALI
jgi:TIR domain-containing protein